MNARERAAEEYERFLEFEKRNVEVPKPEERRKLDSRCKQCGGIIVSDDVWRRHVTDSPLPEDEEIWGDVCGCARGE